MVIDPVELAACLLGLITFLIILALMLPTRDKDD